MRLITYIRNDVQRLGAWIDNDQSVVDLAAASMLVHGNGAGVYSTMQSLIEGGEAPLDRARRLLEKPPVEAIFPTSACKLRSPLPQPTQLRDFLAFPEHVRGCRITLGELMINDAADPEKKRAELNSAKYFDIPAGYFDHPVYYTGNRLSISGDQEDIVWPTFSNFIDYELEWAVVIGKSGKAISNSEAKGHIFGYTIFNDWSARDEQMKAMGGAVSLGPGVGKDFANTIGPCIVTADEISDPYSLGMRAYLNGKLVSSGNTSAMHFKFEELIEYVSRAHAIYPGEIMGSGTVGGGCSLETRVHIGHGDIIKLEVDQIGELQNRVLAPHIDSHNSDSFSKGLMNAMKGAIKA